MGLSGRGGKRFLFVEAAFRFYSMPYCEQTTFVSEPGWIMLLPRCRNPGAQSCCLRQSIVWACMMVTFGSSMTLEFLARAIIASTLFVPLESSQHSPSKVSLEQFCTSLVLHLSVASHTTTSTTNNTLITSNGRLHIKIGKLASSHRTP